MVGTTAANWTADTATATLVAGYVSTVSLNFKQNNNVSVTANFSGNVAEIYTSLIGRNAAITTPYIPAGYKSAWAQYSILAEDEAKQLLAP